MKSIKDQENLKDKIVLLRLDLNVPLKNGIIKDQTRISDKEEFSGLIRRLSTQTLTISSRGHIMGLFKDNNYFVSGLFQFNSSLPLKKEKGDFGGFIEGSNEVFGNC